MKCPKCKYEWETNSKLKMVTCPNCLLKVPKISTNHDKKELNLNGVIGETKA